MTNATLNKQKSKIVSTIIISNKIFFLLTLPSEVERNSC